MGKYKINEKKLLKIIKDLISINSINPYLDEKGNGEWEIANYISEFLKEIGLEVNCQKIDEKRTNIIGILKGNGKGKTLMLNGHTDTVGVEGMSIQPFFPKFEKGKIYGRGSADMKGGLSAMLIAADSIANSNLNLKGDVIFAFVVDEEYKSKGTENLVEEYSADAAIVCEPTDLKIGITHKGFVWLKVEVFGKAAHGSCPSEGIDAIVKAGKFLIELEDYETRIIKRRHKLLGSPSVHASKIHGGREISTYPDYCYIEIERRTLPGEEIIVEEEINYLIERVSRRDKNFKAKSEVLFLREALRGEENDLIVNSLEKAYKRVLKRKPEFIGLSFWTDGAILEKSGIPTVVFGPSGKGLHSEVEYVDFKSIVYTTKILIETIIDFCDKY